MEPTRLFPIIVLLSLVTVEYGGWALLGFLTGHGTLGAFRERFFAAGHAHAGVLLVLSLVYFVYLGRAGYSTGVQWLAGALLLVGVLVLTYVWADMFVGIPPRTHARRGVALGAA